MSETPRATAGAELNAIAEDPMEEDFSFAAFSPAYKMMAADTAVQTMSPSGQMAMQYKISCGFTWICGSQKAATGSEDSPIPRKVRVM